LAGQAKTAMRRVADRILRPYVDEVIVAVHESGPPPDRPPLAPPFYDQHAALHEARSLALADMPPGAQTVLSVGANGRWYFDWFDEEYGPIARHIGVEAYMPRPDDLPANVEWIEADVADREGAATVSSGSVDLVFCGQNLEHLWPGQMVAMLVEANRVLRDGGWLVVDSPNRLLTAELNWSMSEHTVELTPDEATQLLEAAGYAVEVMKGLWLCRKEGPGGPVRYALEPCPDATGTGATLRRMALARQRPQDSFIWWAEARKVAPPDVEAVRELVLGIFEANWAERVGRMRPHDGTPLTLADGRRGAELPRGTPGFVVIGPWMPVPEGTYDFVVEVAWGDPTDPEESLGTLEVVVGTDVIGSIDVPGRPRAGTERIACRASFSEQSFAVHARLHSTGNARLVAPLSLEVNPDPWRTLTW
jgi:SAM-dependent methyltransferase